MSEQVVRQWEILKLIPDRMQRRSTAEIWDALRGKNGYEDVQKRTVERDLSVLLGVFPIETCTEGRTNYWYWTTGASVWMPGLTEDEAMAFYLVEANLRLLMPRASFERLEPYFKAARAKLSGQSKRNRSQTRKFRKASAGATRRPQALGVQMEIAEVAKGIQAALLNDRKLRIDYLPDGINPQMASRLVNPLALVEKEEELFLVYSEDGSTDPRFMPIAGIDAAIPSITAFDGPANLDIDAYIASGAIHNRKDLPLPVGEWIEVALDITQPAYSRMARKRMGSLFNVRLDRNGRRRATLIVRFTPDLADWLLSQGPEIRVHGPAPLRKWLAAQLAPAAAQYRGDQEFDDSPITYRWYQDWDSKHLTCSCCGWTGQARAEELEPRDSGAAQCDFRCPTCERTLLIVCYAGTRKEIEQNWQTIDPWTRAMIKPTPERLDEFERTRLKSADQLPDLDHGPSYPDFLTWNIVFEQSGESFNVLTHGGKRVWRQIAVWGAADEFARVSEIVHARYGRPIREIRVTPVARGYLAMGRNE